MTNPYCSYCKKNDHSDDECWCTRIVGWSPEYGHSLFAFMNYFSKIKKEEKPNDI